MHIYRASTKGVGRNYQWSVEKNTVHGRRDPNICAYTIGALWAVHHKNKMKQVDDYWFEFINMWNKSKLKQQSFWSKVRITFSSKSQILMFCLGSLAGLDKTNTNFATISNLWNLNKNGICGELKSLQESIGWLNYIFFCSIAVQNMSLMEDIKWLKHLEKWWFVFRELWTDIV